MNSFSFRSAIPSDAEGVAKVYLSSRKVLVAFVPIVHSEEAVYEWIRDILIPGNQVTVEQTGWINPLYSHPDVVSQRMGTKLIEQAKIELGSPSRLYTFQDNQRAIRFHERHGFKAVQYGDGFGNAENCPAVLYEWCV